jgi:hypothetical protein
MKGAKSYLITIGLVVAGLVIYNKFVATKI